MNQLKKWRKGIDKLDNKLIDILYKRCLITKKIQKYKIKYKIKKISKKRESQIIKRLQGKFSNKQVKNLIKAVYFEIFRNKEDIRS